MIPRPRLRPRRPRPPPSGAEHWRDRGGRGPTVQQLDRTSRARLLGGTDTILGAVTVQPPDPRGLRISDADREIAAQHLQRAFTEGRITASELDERLSVVYAARYEADLRPPLADLPSHGPAPVLTPAGPPLVLKAGMSAIKRTGAWRCPPASGCSRHGFGGPRLRDAENPHPVVEVELELGAGRRSCWCPTTPPRTSTTSSRAWGRARRAVGAAARSRTSSHGRTAMGSVRVPPLPPRPLLDRARERRGRRRRGARTRGGRRGARIPGCPHRSVVAAQAPGAA
jgi:hypothetical protein